MEMRLYTVLRPRRGGDLLAIADTRRPLGALPPIWALVNGLWLTAFAMVLLLATAAQIDPRLVGPVWAALAFLSILEGSAIESAERRLRGWREVALVEARSPEGAEEQALTLADPARPAHPTPAMPTGAAHPTDPAAASAHPRPDHATPAGGANPTPNPAAPPPPVAPPAGLGQPAPAPAPGSAPPAPVAPPAGWGPPAPASPAPPGPEADGPGPLAAALRALADPVPAATATDTASAPDSPTPPSEPKP